ncbi:MAG TPA: hypothetical protein VIM73_11180 [Polyangiaceae bacterium]
MRLSPAFFLLAALTVPASATAWERDAAFGARVHGHEFTRVVLRTSNCQIEYSLRFSAPAAAYPRSGLGYYRFHVRVQLSDGRSIVSPVFGNRAPGERVYTQSFDTTPDGCWASREHKLFGVNVEACRGRTCTPDPFGP